MRDDELMERGKESGMRKRNQPDSVEIIGSSSRSHIDWVTKELYQFQAENGKGKQIKENFNDCVVDELAKEGVFAFWNGNLIGGLTFHIHNDWVFLHCGYVQSQYRGLGIYTELLKKLEKTAKDSGLSGVFLSTYDFEAPDFYEKQKYKRGAVLNNCPKGNTSIDYYKDFSEVN